MRSKAELGASIRGGGRAVLVVNSRSRRGRREYAEALRLLIAARIGFVGLYPVTDPERLPEIFAEALELDPDLVVVGGGDGTLKEAVRHLAHRDIALGLLPLGTTNNFARGLQLPLRLSGAVEVIARGKVADVDLAEIVRDDDSEPEIFANMLSMGLSVKVAENVPHLLKRYVGRAAYPLTAIARLARDRAFTATLTVDGEVHTLKTHQLNIANGSHHSGRPIARDASPDDRLLAVYPLGGAGRVKLLSATARHVLTGAFRTITEPPFVTAGKVGIVTDPPMAADVDGELHPGTPMTVTLLPNALRVMVKQDFPDT
ncbi:diacylglycerol/lipid kinase family protein [Actinocorallia sp. A-T 12471]|uniref:diacylglycerol/lipid kinase family protein n=1 Tax=Actinocorallia sp. A-T 12471 TaxID=3089813 RepID=UPI0029D01D18|nr:diacylglycerol kinase family protein [Actinocorallia sp. A-T 12471]MDX6739412.1 diacylglycerol kinase family protein [Actinocorallia sp. A-T 12471]